MISVIFALLFLYYLIDGRKYFISRLFCRVHLLILFPHAFKIIQYDILESISVENYFLFSFYLISWLFGARVNDLKYTSFRTFLSNKNLAYNFDHRLSNRSLLILWCLGMCAFILYSLDYVFYKRNISNLSDLRDYIMQNTSPFSQWASILTWASFLCFFYVSGGYSNKSRLKNLVLISPVLAIMGSSLLSAGRQGIFQILIILLAISILRGSVYMNSFTYIKRMTKRIVFLVPLISIVVIITLGRNDGLISDEKHIVLERLFGFHFSSFLTFCLFKLPTSVTDTLVEALVYLTNSTPGLLLYLTGPIKYHTYGATNFPFFFRQIEFITEFSVVEIMERNVSYVKDLGGMPYGWTMSYSGLLRDFGWFFSFVLTFSLGYFSSVIMKWFFYNPNFWNYSLFIVILINIFYIPMFSVFSDTSFFLLFLVLLIKKVYNKSVVSR